MSLHSQVHVKGTATSSNYTDVVNFSQRPQFLAHAATKPTCQRTARLGHMIRPQATAPLAASVNTLSSATATSDSDTTSEERMAQEYNRQMATAMQVCDTPALDCLYTHLKFETKPYAFSIYLPHLGSTNWQLNAEIKCFLPAESASRIPLSLIYYCINCSGVHSTLMSTILSEGSTGMRCRKGSFVVLNQDRAKTYLH